MHRAVKAARRVGGGLIVAALNVGGLRSGAAVLRRMPAASALRAEKAIAERSRGARGASTHSGRMRWASGSIALR